MIVFFGSESKMKLTMNKFLGASTLKLWLQLGICKKCKGDYWVYIGAYPMFGTSFFVLIGLTEPLLMTIQ